jgi:hypothetical protein
MIPCLYLLPTDILHLILGQPPRSRLDDNNCLLTKPFSISLAAAQPWLDAEWMTTGRMHDVWSAATGTGGSHLRVSGFCFVLVGIAMNVRWN